MKPNASPSVQRERRRSRRRIDAASFAMTGATSPAVREADAPVPFRAVDDQVPYSLALIPGASFVWDALSEVP